MNFRALILLFGAFLASSRSQALADTVTLDAQTSQQQSALDAEFVAQYELAKSENRLLSIQPTIIKMPEPSGQLHGPYDPKTQAELARSINANVDYLRRTGKLPATSEKAVQGSSPIFEMPIRKRPAWGAGGFFDCCNFVDQNLSNGGVLDYACGNRTFDGHNGIDFGIFPFPWKAMDSNLIEVVAAAPGVIVQKIDGNFDRSCTVNGNQANLIVIDHPGADRRSFYLHMKSGSLTTKSIGASVVAGEFLGLIGSSGSSTAPHLHFEVRTAPTEFNPLGDVIEPFSGTCNQASSPSEWIGTQEPYLNPRLNKVIISNGNPQFSDPCPSANPLPEVTNEQYIFEVTPSMANPKHSVFLNDLRAGQKYVFRVRKPNGGETIWQHPHALTVPPTIPADAHGNAALVYEVSNDRDLGVWEWTASLMSDQNIVLQSLTVQYQFVEPRLFDNGFEGP